MHRVVVTEGKRIAGNVVVFLSGETRQVRVGAPLSCVGIATTVSASVLGHRVGKRVPPPMRSKKGMDNEGCPPPAVAATETREPMGFFFGKRGAG